MLRRGGVIVFVSWFCFFFLVIQGVFLYTASQENTISRELIYIDPTHYHGWHDDIVDDTQEQLKSMKDFFKSKKDLSSAFSIRTLLYPQSFDFVNEASVFVDVLRSKYFAPKINSEILLEFFEDKWEVRWKMKKKTIQIFGPKYQDDDEVVAVFIHEFAHYLDLYFLQKKIQHTLT